MPVPPQIVFGTPGSSSSQVVRFNCATTATAGEKSGPRDDKTSRVAAGRHHLRPSGIVTLRVIVVVASVPVVVAAAATRLHPLIILPPITESNALL